MNVNGKLVTNVDELIESIKEGEEVNITLTAGAKLLQQASQGQEANRVIQNDDRVLVEDTELKVDHTYIIKVRQYMTKPSEPGFDFQDKWNNGVPMPFRVMKGLVLRETRGMVYMSCHGVPMKTDSCMACGRRLTHPVSRLYGIGPECGQHYHVNPFSTEEELYAALDDIKKKLQEVTWEGWIIKSAVERAEEVK
jgi:uncharacterized protein YlzI (FlbEa/FlbD family)